MQNANATLMGKYYRKKYVYFGHQILLEVNCPKGKRILLAMGM